MIATAGAYKYLPCECFFVVVAVKCGKLHGNSSVSFLNSFHALYTSDIVAGGTLTVP